MDIQFLLSILVSIFSLALVLIGNPAQIKRTNGFIWDFAPSALMLAEAGWKITDFNGDPFRWTGKVEYGHPGVIAAQPELHEQFLGALRV